MIRVAYEAFDHGWLEDTQSVYLHEPVCVCAWNIRVHLYASDGQLRAE